MIKRTFLVRALALIGLFVPALYADSALDEGAERGCDVIRIA